MKSPQERMNYIIKKLNVAKHSVKNTGDPAAARGVLPANCPAKSRLCALVMIPYPHAVQTQNVCDACAFASNTCTRTSNNIYYTPLCSQEETIFEFD